MIIIRRIKMKIFKGGKVKFTILAIVAVVLVSVGGTFAYVGFKTDSIINIFKHGVVNITTDEDFGGGEISTTPTAKKVRIKNDSLNGKLNVVPVYIRVSLVSTWKNDDGTVAAINADDLIDYKLNLNDSSTTEFVKNANVDGKWVLGNDGFYYFTGVVDADKYTDYLLETVALKDGATTPENGHLEVNVLADAVQADMAKVNQAWNTPKDTNGNQIYAE